MIISDVMKITSFLYREGYCHRHRFIVGLVVITEDVFVAEYFTLENLLCYTIKSNLCILYEC